VASDWVAQVLGAVAASAILYVIATGNGLASNDFGEHSAGRYSLGAAFLTEVIMSSFP
jgi:aquaporin Z